MDVSGSRCVCVFVGFSVRSQVDDVVFHVLPPSESFERADALITQKKEKWVSQWLFLVPLKGGIGSIFHPPEGNI